MDKVKQFFNTASISERIIAITISVTALQYIYIAIAALMKWNQNAVMHWFELPSSFDTFLTRPWTLVTYSFFHGGLWHLLFNMLFLYLFSRLFLDFFSNKQYLLYYFGGVIVGGIVFMLSYNYFPALVEGKPSLIGASAGVTAILIGLTSKIPQYAIHFRFIGAIKLWQIAALLIFLDIMRIPLMSNTGGHLAHLGGALIGFLLTTQMNEGKRLLAYFDRGNKSKKRGPLKTVYKNSKPSRASLDKNAEQKKIDRILDKISNSGYDTLSQEEKDYLNSVGKKK